MPQDEWPTLEAQRAIIESDFDSSGPYGDRRQVKTHCLPRPLMCKWE